MENNIITFNTYPMTMQAIITNPKLLTQIRKEEAKAQKQIEAAIKQLEKENGKKYPQ